MKKVSLLLFLAFCMCVSGCGGSGNSGNSISNQAQDVKLDAIETPLVTPTPSNNPTQLVSVTLPAKYQINGTSYDLPSGKSWRIIACGNTSNGVEAFQEHIFTQTGSTKSFQIPVSPDVAQYIVVNTIALDGSFTDDSGVQGRCLMVVKIQNNVGSITVNETDDFWIIGSSSSMMKISNLLKLYQTKFNCNYNLKIK